LERQNGSGTTAAATARDPRGIKLERLPVPDTAIRFRTQAYRPRLMRLAAQLHELGPRATYELFLELIEGAPLMERLEVYCRLDPDVLRALGGDRLPAVRVVAGGRR